MKAVSLLIVVSIAVAWNTTPRLASADEMSSTRTCTDEANTKHLTGKSLQTFLRTCRQGALAPAKPASGEDRSPQAKLITAPSGADRIQRSADCTAEAQRRRLDDNQAKAFRLNCLASAAPVAATGGADRPPVPTPSKPGYDTLPR